MLGPPKVCRALAQEGLDRCRGRTLADGTEGLPRQGLPGFVTDSGPSAISKTWEAPSMKIVFNIVTGFHNMSLDDM